MIYFVTFERQAGGRIDQMIYHCEASNAAEAKAAAKAAWEKANSSHMFHLYAKRSRAISPEYLQVISWDSKTCTGEHCMNRFICTETKRWRRTTR